MLQEPSLQQQFNYHTRHQYPKLGASGKILVFTVVVIVVQLFNVAGRRQETNGLRASLDGENGQEVDYIRRTVSKPFFYVDSLACRPVRRYQRQGTNNFVSLLIDY